MYLKAGAGNAWAGHKIVMFSFSLASKARLLSVVVNLGETRPTGSMNKWRYIWILSLFYLNKGTGNACAGHNKVKLALSVALKLLELSIEGNLGETRPTGSRDNIKIYLKYLNSGVGNAWAGQSIVTHAFVENVKLRPVSIDGNLGDTFPIGSVYKILLSNETFK